MKKKITFKSLRVEMMLSFAVLIMMALLVFAVFSMRYTEDTVLDNSKEYTGQIVDMVSDEMDSFISYMENIMEITDRRAIDSFLYGTEEEKASASIRLTEQFSQVLDSRDNIVNIAILGDNGRFVCNKGRESFNTYVDYKKEEWYQKTIEADGESVVSYSHVQNLMEHSYPWVITLSRGIKNQETGKIDGVFFIDLNYGEIQKLCKKTAFGSKGYMFVVDQEGRIIYHPRQQLLISGLQEEELDKVLSCKESNFIQKRKNGTYLYSICHSKKTNWMVVGVAETGELIQNKRDMFQAYLLAAVVLLAFALLISIFFAQNLIRPIQKLQRSMYELQRGRFERAGISVDGDNEIASLEKSFNVMSQEIQHLMKENVKEQEQKRKSELMALQSQINPHFLYNTLDSIIWMAEWGKTEEVVLMTSSLARLLRQSIGNEDEIISVRKEIEYTRSYLTIQKMRYRDQLEYEIDVPENIQRMNIIKLTLQPLVENAIYHGIKYLDEGGLIRVTGYVEGEKVVISIQDNGPGMEEEVLKHILDKKPDTEQRSKVGVYNVHNRLQLYYGASYGLQYESKKGEGTIVKMTIPYLFDSEQEVVEYEEK